ncbi:DUF5675 family protein [Mucilaginibacter sp.]|uniref:DUF5675 family protein n=1 Tax=Mucilaginibacter sp. TaxID=1882438 RepID=UPI003D142822
MNLKVTRKVFNENDTIGILYIDETKFSFTLEDIVRPKDEPKVFGKTAIPAGTYKVILSHSNHFNRILPEILNVPGFEGIRMHSGNTELDTEGCILVAYHTDNQKIWDSAIDKLVDLMTDKEEITITVQ